MNVSRHRIFADHYQFYLSDAAHPGVPDDDVWAPEAFERMLSQGNRFVAVRTVRSVRVRVSIEVHSEEVSVFSPRASHVVEFGISLPSGGLRICGCTDVPESAPQVDVAEGDYAGLMLYERLDSTYLFGLLGFDGYRVILWPGAVPEPRVVKAWPRAGKI